MESGNSGNTSLNDTNSNSTSKNDDISTTNQSDALSVFCREVRNLLRSKPNCMIPFSKFVPAYHNHYGRQCCVYQFGFTKLVELLESIPHVVQILGEGNNRYITLTRREQIKRFASDLIKVIKSQPGKKLKLSQFPRAYEQVLGRVFRVEDYGTNDINDLLSEIWEGTINIIPIKSNSNNNDNSTININNSNNVIMNKIRNNNSIINNKNNNTNKNNNNNNNETTTANANDKSISLSESDAWFRIPKRERSEKEISRTKYFIWDVIELLSHMEPDYTVQFSRFIPSYHYYFNRQCKVSIFGFSKLIDLFESISPDVVEILDDGSGDEKIIKLADRYIPTTRMSHVGGNGSEQNGSDYGLNNVDGDADSDSNDSDLDSIQSIINNDTEDEELNENNANDMNHDDGSEDEYSGDDIIMPLGAIDNGPTEEELRELEEELIAYEQLKAIQSKRSSRMSANFIFQILP